MTPSTQTTAVAPRLVVFGVDDLAGAKTFNTVLLVAQLADAADNPIGLRSA